VQQLVAAGVDVDDLGDLPAAIYQARAADPTQRNLSDVVSVVRRVAERVREALARGRPLLVVGGDCTITLGVVAGFQLYGRDVGVVYFDGDADLSTPSTSQSGILDAMGVAHLLGEGAPELARSGPRYPLLEPGQLVLFGYDDQDLGPPAQALLARFSPPAWPTSRMRGASGGPVGAAAAALAELEPEVGTILVHFDLDAIDSGDLPLANFPHFGTGLSLAEATDCLKVFVGTPKLGGLVVTELNPDHDPDGSQLPRLVDSLVSALSGA
jgi:arginase